MTDTEAIAEFARNEMVRADHTISWAGPVENIESSIIRPVSFFYVRSGEKVFRIRVSEALEGW